MTMTKREHLEFAATKVIVERVHRRLNIPRQYLSRDWKKDEELLRESVWRKQVLWRQEAERIAMFESWQHGRQVVEIEAEAPQEERRAS
jgi:hypothetical protein